MRKRMIVLFLGFALVGCSGNSAGGNSEGDMEYETLERAALEEDIMDGNTLERYAAVDCDVVEVKMMSKDQKDEVIDTDGEEESVQFSLYEMEIQDVISSSNLSAGDSIVVAVSEETSAKYPKLSDDMTYIIPVYKADEESVNAGNYLIADYSLFYVIDNTDGNQTIKAAYVEDKDYDGLSIDEFKNQLADYAKAKETVIWGEDYTKSNAYLADGDSCRLVVPFAYTDESAVVELVSVSGINTDMADIDLNQDSEWDIIQDVEYKGYKLGICGLMITPTGNEPVTVDEMVVSVNGENNIVSFTDPITYIPCEASEDIFMSTSMMAIQTNDPLTLTVSIGAVNPVTLTGYEIMGEYKEITDPLDPEDGKSCIIIVGDSSYEGDTEVELDKGMEATYKINLAPTNEYAFSYNDFIVYYKDASGNDKKYISCFTNQWIRNEDDVTQMLKLLVDE